MRRVGRALGRTLRACVVLWLGTYAAVLVWTYAWPVDRSAPMGDVIVCLSGGGDVPRSTPDGMRSRAETCGLLYRAGAAPRVLFTGGALSPDLPSSAAVMARASGVPAAAVIIEPRARSTLQNAVFSLQHLPDAARLIVVTEAYHLPRAWVSFRLMGADEVRLYASARAVANPDGPFMERHPVLRESLAIWFNIARAAVFALGGALGVPQDARVDLIA
jgi:uncharacterized SAM-binding protein YcdF (DUF218 family)